MARIKSLDRNRIRASYRRYDQRTRKRIQRQRERIAPLVAKAVKDTTYDIAANLRRLATNQMMSQKEIVRLSGLSKETVCRLFRGELYIKRPDGDDPLEFRLIQALEILMALALTFKVPLWRLLYANDHRTPLTDSQEFWRNLKNVTRDLSTPQSALACLATDLGFGP